MSKVGHDLYRSVLPLFFTHEALSEKIEWAHVIYDIHMILLCYT